MRGRIKQTMKAYASIIHIYPRISPAIVTETKLIYARAMNNTHENRT
jgi:hypothetical protein